MHKIFTNHSSLGRGIYAFSYPLALKLQFSMRTTERKACLTLLILITFFSLPVMFSTGLRIITAKCNEIEKGKENGLLGNFPILEMQC